MSSGTQPRKIVSIVFGIVSVAILASVVSYYRDGPLVRKIPRQAGQTSPSASPAWVKTSGSYSFVENEGEIKIDWAATDTSDQHTIQTFEAEENQTIDFGGGETARLETIHVSYHIGPDPEDAIAQAFNAATFEAIEAPESIHRYTEAKINPTLFPRLVLHFEGKRFESRPELSDLAGKPFQFQGFGGTSSRNRFAMAKTLIPWYSQPTVITADFLYGEPDEVILPLKVGARGEFQNVRFEIVEIRDFDHPFSSFSIGKGSIETRLEKSREWKTCLAIVHLAEVREVPYEIETVVMEDGEERTAFGCSFRMYDQFGFLIVSGRHAKRVEAIKFSKRNQAVGKFTLRKMPGLPDENYGLTNAFDTLIPYVNIGKYSRFTAAAAGLEEGELFAKNSIPDTEFPLVYEKTTLQSIARELREKRGIFRLNVKDNSILEGKRSPEQLFEAAKLWAKSLRSR